MSDVKALLSPEVSLKTIQNNGDCDEMASSSGYLSQPGQQNAQNSSQNNNQSSISNSHNRPFVRRGSLLINNVAQKFNYHDDPDSQSAAMSPLMERNNQESYRRCSIGDHGAGVDDGNNASPTMNNNDNAGEINGEQDGNETLTLHRQSSSSRTSLWRTWVDTTCCFGYIHLRCTWIFHPQGPLSYFWLLIVSIAVLYNIIEIPLRFAFCGWNMNLGLAATTDDIIKGKNISSALKAIPATFPSRDIAFWMIPDYFFDLIYAVDILKSMRTGYFEEGFMNANPPNIFSHYVGSASFYADVLSLLPLDLLYLSFGLNSLLRLPRIIKIYRYIEFVNWTERHTRWPNVVRSIKMFAYVLLLSHWNAALCKTALQGYESIWFQKDSMPKTNDTQTVSVKGSDDFLASATDLRFYWAWLYVSVSTLCTLGLSGTSGLDYNGPALIFVFLTFQMMLGLVLFAVAIGEILVIVDSLGAGQREFQMHLDAVKNYMGKRNIPKPVRVKVIRWFDYIWESRRGFDEERRHLMILPECLQADISLHAYLHTLKQVEFFRNTEAGFLKELVLRLKPTLFSPKELICRKGEIGRNMYIIELGLLQVFNGKTANTKPVAHLRKGQYFGELSILNMGKAGNRRTATIRSVGYSHLLSLCKDDLFTVLQDFPKERARLEYFAAKRCEQYHQEKMQEKLKRQQSRETISQVILNETTEQQSWLSNNTGSDPIGTITTGVEQAPSSSYSADSNDDEQNKVTTWQNETDKTPLKCPNFTRSECDLSLPAVNEIIMSDDSNQFERRTSLTTVSTPRKRVNYRMRQSNLVARINVMSHAQSPLLRVARSMDLITGRESVL